MKSFLKGRSLRRKKHQRTTDAKIAPGAAFRFRPRLESFEDRLVPAAVYGVRVFDDGVPVTGTLFPNWGGNPNSLAFLGGSTNFSSQIVLGTTNSPGTPGGATLHLNPQSMVSSTSGGTHTLRIELTSTDYAMPTGSPVMLSASAGGEYVGGGTVTSTYQTYFDPNNGAFGMPAGSATPVQTATVAGATGPLVYSPGTAGKFFLRPNPLFSMTSVIEYTVSGSAGATLNTTTSTVAGTASIDIEKYVKGQESGGNGGEGLTPGFWKNHSIYGNAPIEKEAWTATGYHPDNSYNTIFNVTAAQTGGAKTLYQALQTGGGGVNALLRHSTAGLLNSARADIDYAYTTAQVIQMTHDAIVSGNAALIESTKDLFAKENEKGATLGDTALFLAPAAGYGADADLPPGPTFPVGSQVTFTYVVSNPSNVRIAGVAVTDNVLGSVTPVLFEATAFNIGDDNFNTFLDPGEVWIYTATEIATAGQHTNTGTVVGTPVLLDGNGNVVATGTDTPVTDHDDANYNAGGTVNNPVSKIDIEKYVKAPTSSEAGGQGLTPGYWKQTQHFGSWNGYTRTDSYNAIFGVSDPDSPTLLGALQRGGGGYNALGRHAVAALLNSVSVTPDINYAYTTAQVIAMVQAAYAAGGDVEGTKNLLATENEKELSGGGSGTPTPGFGVDADAPPGPLVLPGTVLTFTLTVQNSGQTPLAGVTITDKITTPVILNNTPVAVLVDGFNAGDDNQNGMLDPSELWLYTYTLTASTTTFGQYTNSATATGTPANVNGTPLGTPNVTDTDVANWKVNNPSVVTAGAVTTNKKEVKLTLTDKGVASVTLTKLTLTWPSANGKLQKVSLAGKAVFSTVTSWTAGGLTTQTFTGSALDRTIAAGKSKDLVFLFEKNVLTGPYTIGLTFSDGSTLTVTKAATMLAGGTAWTPDSGEEVLGGVTAGEYLVYVGGLQGDAAAGMQVRIAAAIDEMNAALAAFGVTVAQVGEADAASANIFVYLAETSVLGGVAEGVLGVTESGGAITLITGWDWYVGSDPAGIGAGQFDFQTVVTHELAHALGLGHSGDGGSVMFPFLDTAQARRALTAADLVIIEEESGTEGLFAAPTGPAAFVAPLADDRTATVTVIAAAPTVRGATVSVAPDWRTADAGATKVVPDNDTAGRVSPAGQLGFDPLGDDLLLGVQVGW